MNLRHSLARLLMPPKLRSGYDVLAEMLQGGHSVLIGMGETGRLGGWTYQQFAQEGYAESAIVYACMRWIMQGCSSLGLGIKQKGELLEELPAPLEPLVRLLKRPNPTQAIDEFIELGVLHQYFSGMQHIRRIGTGTETIGGRLRGKAAPELWLLQPDCLRLTYGRYGITEYVLDDKEIIPPDEVLTIKFPHPGTAALGMPSLEPLRRQIDTYGKVNSWNGNIFDNNGVPAGVLGVKGLSMLNEAERKARRKEWSEQYEGVKNAGKVMILDSEVAGFTKLAVDYKDLDWLQGKQDIKREISAALGVPSVLVGDPESSTYANYEMALRALYTNTVLPFMQHWAGELTEWLCPQYGKDLEIAVLTDHVEVLRDDENDKTDRQSKKQHWTINELRADDGLPPITGNPDAEIPLALLNVFDPTDMLAGEEQPDKEQDAARSLRTRSTRTYHPRTFYPTLEERAAYMTVQERRRLSWQRVMRKRAVQYFGIQRDAILTALDGKRSIRAVMPDVDAILRELGPLYADQFGEIYEGMYQSFGDLALERFKQGGFNLDNSAVKERIATDLAARSELIDAYTAKRVGETLRAGMDANEGVYALKERVTAEFASITPARAEAIARTEVARAQSGASVEAWQQTDVVTSKEWISAGDDAVRDEHAEADGQVVGLNEPFAVGGEYLEAPGMGYEPENNINCRCVAAPIVD